MKKKLPYNWPKTLIYSKKYITEDIHPQILKQLLLTNKKNTYKNLSIIDTGKTDPDITIKILGKDHPLYHLPTPMKHSQRGLFATNTIDKNTLLGEFIGEIKVQNKNFPIIKDFSTYGWVLEFINYYLLIEANKYANELVFVNDYHNIKKNPNTEGAVIVYKNSFHFVYKTIKKILKHEEILIDYGKLH